MHKQELLSSSFRRQGNNNGLVWGTIIQPKKPKITTDHDGRDMGTGFREKDGKGEGWL